MKKLIKIKFNQNGFTLLESIFSLFVVSIGLSLLITALPLLSKINQFDVYIEEEIALEKIREIILFASSIEVYSDEIIFYSMEDDASLILERTRIVRTPGYLILMDGLEQSEFAKKGSCIYLKYERNNIQKQRFLGCK